MNKFIKDLAKSAKPVQQLASPLTRLGAWLIIAFICLFIGIAITGVSAQFKLVFTTPILFLETLSIILMSISAAVIALLLSVPGRFKPRMLGFVGLPFMVWVSLLSFRMWQLYSQTGVISWIEKNGFGCISNLLIIGLIPSIVLFSMIYLAAPLKSKLTGFIGLIAGMGLAALGLQFTCVFLFDPFHIAAFHVLPIVLIAICGIYLGKVILKKGG